jgi:hypothetical protein
MSYAIPIFSPLPPLDALDPPDEPEGPEPFEFELLPQAVSSIADAAMPATAAVR